MTPSSVTEGRINYRALAQPETFIKEKSLQGHCN